MFRFNTYFMTSLVLLNACTPNPQETSQSVSTASAASIVYSNSSEVSIKPNPFGKMVVHKDAHCGCCGEYAKYLRQHGAEVEEVVQANMAEIRQKMGTIQGASCHTVEVGGYVVEGHVPIAAIEKLLREKPDIKGIALPGMPMNSPGMGKEIKGSLQVMAIEHDGSVKRVFSVE